MVRRRNRLVDREKREKAGEEKWIEAQRAKPRTTTTAIDALIGEEQTRTKKQGAGLQPSYP